MTKRTTEQQRARELQRAEHAQGKHTSYHDALNRVRAGAQAQPAGPTASPVAVLPVQLTAAEEAEDALFAVLFERTAALMASHSRAELTAMARESGFDGERFSPGAFSTQELASLLVQYEDRVRRGEAQPADFMPLVVLPAVRTAAEEAEATLAHERFERTQALMASHSKRELAAMVRKLGGGNGKYGPELWEKQEIAGHLVYHEDAVERYQAYGTLGDVPASGIRPRCGGTGCTGHDTMTPWLETRERFRAQTPCISTE
jgi:hypothetical protein